MNWTPLAAFDELLARLTASSGGAVYLDEQELEGWPAALLHELKASQMLGKASPATSTLCPGCERACAMPVEVLSRRDDAVAAFVVCDKRIDINRVEVQVSALTRWKATGESLANALARLLQLDPRPQHADTPGRWHLGTLIGKRHKDRLVLHAGDAGLTLAVAGHAVAIGDLLSIASKGLHIDRTHLTRLVDQPTGQVAAESESADDRQRRLMDVVAAHKQRNPRSFLRAAAAQEGITVYALKQVIYRQRKPVDALAAMAGALARPVSPKAKR